jgi:hypothetical protein
MAYCRIYEWVEPETERSTVIYDQVSAKVGPMADEASGFIAHAAGWTGNGFRIIEIWETEEASERFFTENVIPAVMEASGGNPGQEPEITGYELYRVMTASGR